VVSKRCFSGLAAASLLAWSAPAPAQGLENIHLGQVWGTVAITKAVLSTPVLLVNQSPVQVAAEASANEGTQFVRSLGDEVIAVLRSEDYSQRKQKFHDIFTGAFDVDAMAQFTAGNYWRKADERQRQEYVRLFGDYVATLYANKFADYTGQSFKVANERVSGDNVAVEGIIVQPQKPPVRVDFRLRKAAGGFKIVDVYVEGMSLLITKRDEFMTVLAREGMDGLISRLRTTSQG
jgi:phospholipid transport system substrate-binding protein